MWPLSVSLSTRVPPDMQCPRPPSVAVSAFAPTGAAESVIAIRRKPNNYPRMTIRKKPDGRMVYFVLLLREGIPDAVDVAKSTNLACT